MGAEQVVKIGLSIGLVSIITASIAFGMAYNDIQKGVEAYEEIRGLDVIELKIDNLAVKIDTLEKKVDCLTDKNREK